MRHRAGIQCSCAIAALFFLVVILPVTAEEASHLVLEGTVKDSHGSPVAGAVVRLSHDGTAFPEATTNSAGKFSIPSLSASTYTMRVGKLGFHDVVETLSLPLPDHKQCAVVLTRSDSTVEKSTSPMQLSEGTDFQVAGITDWTAAGGHGSDVSLRTSESLAKDTRNFANAEPNSNKQDPAALQRTREQLQKKLATDDNADLHRELGDIDEELNDPLAAAHEYERAVQLDPAEPNYFSWGTELLLHRAVQPAVEVFGKGVKSYPHSERMQAGLGAALYASGLYAQAAERLCAASDLSPADPTPYLFLGKMVKTSSDPLPCAEEKLARFSHNEPRNAFASYYYAVALWKRTNSNNGPTAQIESLLNNAISMDPKFGEAYVQLGIFYSASGEETKAMTAYQKATAADPNLAEAHFRLAQAYKKSGQVERAQIEFQKYQQIQKTEAAAVEKQRREVQQFVVVFKGQS